MLFSLKELIKIANLEKNIKCEEITKALTQIGFEVEDVTDFGVVENIKFGQITKVYQNPNGTKLNVCEVQFNDKQRTIQTAAQNVYEKMMVVAFVPGSKVNGITFEAKKIRGIVSEGMLTSLNEFGIEKELLPAGSEDSIFDYKNVSIADDVSDTLGLNDKIIDVNILANRADASSYYVMGMELAAFFGTKPLIPQLKQGHLISQKQVITTNLARALTFIECENDFVISTKEQILLAKHKIKAINPGVDIANLAMLYSGQPVHSYDASKVGNKIKASLSSEKVNVLGNKEVALNNDLVISDEKGAISVASVIGLEKTKVEPFTKKILIEIGLFDTIQVKKAMRAVKIETYAARQGAKGNAKGMLLHALIYLSNRLNNFSHFINLGQIKPRQIPFSENQLNEVSGQNLVKDAKFKSIINKLSSLGFSFNKTSVTIPAYRYDIFTQEDINEEIMRFYGYDNFEPEPLKIKPFKTKEQLDWKQKLQAQGYSEVRTYTLTSAKEKSINPFGFNKQIKLKTFVSQARLEIRNSQMKSLLEIALYNTKQGFHNLNIFSEGMVNDGIKTIALLSNTKSFYEIQNELANLIPGLVFSRMQTNDLHPNVAAMMIINQEQIGWIGQVHPRDASKKYLLAEFIKKSYKIEAVEFKKYLAKPLHFEDINMILKDNEDLKEHLSGYKNAILIKKIDEYKIPGGRKITIRIYKNS